MVEKKWLGYLLLILFASGTVYVALPDKGLKIGFNRDDTPFLMLINSSWQVVAREKSSLRDGRFRMMRDLSETYFNYTYDEIANTTEVIRTTTYQRGPIIKDFWDFWGNITDVTQFPLETRETHIVNGNGFIFQWEIRELKFYDGPTIKNVEGPLTIGKLNLEWDEGSYWNTLYKSGILKVRWRIKSDYVVLKNRVYDPPDEYRVPLFSADIIRESFNSSSQYKKQCGNCVLPMHTILEESTPLKDAFGYEYAWVDGTTPDNLYKTISIKEDIIVVESQPCKGCGNLSANETIYYYDTYELVEVLKKAQWVEHSIEDLITKLNITDGKLPSGEYIINYRFTLEEGTSLDLIPKPFGVSAEVFSHLVEFSNDPSDYNFYDTGDKTNDGSAAQDGQNLSEKGWTDGSVGFVYDDDGFKIGNMSLYGVDLSQVKYVFSGNWSNVTCELAYYDTNDTSTYSCLTTKNTAEGNLGIICANTAQNVATYSYIAGGGWGNSGVTRTVGWHNFTIFFNISAVDLSIDGTVFNTWTTAVTVAELQIYAGAGSDSHFDNVACWNGTPEQRPEVPPDTIFPIWNDPLNKTPLTFDVAVKINISINWTDDVLIDTVLIEENRSGVLTNHTVSNHTADIWNITFTDYPAGIHAWRSLANDSSGNLNISDWFYFTIAPIAPTLNLTLNGTEGNITIGQDSTIWLNGSLIIGDAGSDLILTLNTTHKGTSSAPTNLTTFPTVGYFNVSLDYTATQNYSATAIEYFVNVTDTQPPAYSAALNVTPLTFDVSALLNFSINWTDNILVAGVSIEVNRSGVETVYQASNSTGPDTWNLTLTDFPAGTHYWRSNATDVVGNANVTPWFAFTIDRIAPTLNLTLNGTEGNITLEASSSIWLNISVITGDSNYVIELAVDGESKGKNTGGSHANFTHFPIPGDFNISMNYTQTENYSFKMISYLLTVLDTVPPSPDSPLNVTSPTFDADSLLNFSINWTDNVAVDGVLIETNRSGILENHTATNTTAGRTNQSTLYNLTLTDFPAGIHAWRSHANDTSGNTNTSDWQYFTILRIAPTLNLTLNGTEGNVTISKNSFIWMNGSLLVGDVGSYLVMELNTTLIANETIVANFTQFSVTGLFNVSLFYFQTQNYTALELTYYVNATNTAPTHDAPAIAPSAPDGEDTLICTAQNLVDLEGDAVYNTTNWLVDNQSLTNLLLPFDGSSNNTHTKDYCPLDNYGLVNGATWSSNSAKVGGAYTFDGIDDYIDLNGVVTNFNGTHGSAEVWFKFSNESEWNDSENNVILQVRNATTADTMIITKTFTNELLWRHRGNSISNDVRVNVSGFTDTDYHHIAITWDISEDEVKAYLDGVQQGATQTGLGAWTQQTGNGRVGSNTGNIFNFNGTIDEVRIHNRALSLEQIIEHNATRYNRIIPNETTQEGEFWNCEITPTDLEVDGIAKNVTVFVNDTTAPVCTVLSATPSDIEANSTGRFEIIINCTDKSGINTTINTGDHNSLFVTRTVDETGTPPNFWSIFVPPNNMAVTGGPFTERILRAVGRNESFWYEDLGIFNDTYSYAANDGHYGHLNATSGTDWALLNFSYNVEPAAFESMMYLSHERTVNENKTDYPFYKNNDFLVKYWFLEEIEGEENYTFCIFNNINYSSTPNKDFLIRLCNETYNISGGVKPKESPYCILLDSISTSQVDNIDYVHHNSSYYHTCYGVIEHDLGGLHMTETMFGFYDGNTQSVFGQYLFRGMNKETEPEIINFNETNVTWLSTNGGTSFVQQNYTLDSWMSVIDSGDQFQFGVYVTDNSNNQNNYTNLSILTDDIGDVNFPISSPNIISYNSPGGGLDINLNGTHSGIMNITISPGRDPDDNGTVNHSIHLFTADGVFNQTINESVYSGDDTEFIVFFDLSTISAGQYKINVTAVADDNPLDVQSFLPVNNFTIPGRTINLSFGPNVSVFRFGGCGPQIRNSSSFPQGQNTSHGIDKICNNGTGVFAVDVLVNISGAMNTGWSIYASNTSVNTSLLNLSTTSQRLYTDLTWQSCIFVWYNATCNNVTQNPGITIDYWAREV